MNTPLRPPYHLSLGGHRLGVMTPGQPINPAARQLSAFCRVSLRQVFLAASGWLGLLLLVCSTTMGQCILPATNYEVGLSNMPTSVAVGDVNGDTHPDIITANSGSDSVSVLLGRSGGGFQTATSYGVGDGPTSVVVWDANFDGHPDIITANSKGNSVSVLLGQSGGGFGPVVNYYMGNGPRAVVFGDVNADGRADMITANGSSNSVSVRLGHSGVGVGPTTSYFGLPTSYGVGSGPTSVAVEDVNADERADIITANAFDNSVSVLLSQSGGGFQTATNYKVDKVPRAVVVEDVNGDTFPDIITANGSSNNVSVLLGQGDGNFGSATTYGMGDGPISVAVGDVNGDTHLDIITANYSSKNVSVLLGQSGGGFEPAINFGVGDGPTSVVLGDVNVDGQADIITANYFSKNVSVLLNGSSSITRQPSSGSAVCAGGSVTASVAVTGTNLTYQWYKDGQPLTDPAWATTPTLSLTDVQQTSTGTYWVVVTNSCLASLTSTSFSLSVLAAPTATLSNNGPITCSIPSVILSASGGTTGETLSYQFSEGASYADGQPFAVVNTAGVYSVKVMGANGCSATASTTVAEDVGVPTATLSNNGPITCSIPSVTLSASGGSTGETLSYRFSAGASQIDNGPTATVSSPGLYSVTVVGTNGCSAIASTTVEGDVSVPVVGLTNNGPITCSMPSVTLSALGSGGSTYHFSSGASQIDNGPTATVSTAGVYSVTVTSANGCSATTSTTVSEDVGVPRASLTHSGLITCSIRSVVLTANGGSTYRFSIGATQVGGGNTATVSSAGVYSVTAISANGCTATASTTVGGDVSVPPVTLSNNGPITCSMTSVTLTASGGSTYHFSSGASQIDNGRTATVSSAGVYSVTVFGANGCSATAFTTVEGEVSVPVASLTNNGPITCSMPSVTLSASGGGSSYQFSSGATQVGSGNTATVSTAGVYSVTVVGANGCSATASVTVTGDTTPPVVELTASGIISCATPTVTLTATPGPGFTYSFSNGATQVGSGNTATVSQAGTYSVVVTTAEEGCSATASVSVTGRCLLEIEEPTFAITGVTTVSCVTVSATERRLTFAPQYRGTTGQPISFSVVNELLPTTQAGPYSLRLYVDNPTVVLKASQSGTAGEASFRYNWLASCENSNPPTTGSFAITGVTTVSCVTVSATERRLTFAPQYRGTTGQPISFSVVNELLPTTQAGPYSLRLYVDNPTVVLKASQSGTAGEASFRYNWLASCENSNPPTTGSFAITGVTTVSCVTVSATERRLTFAPQYRGTTGQPISFSVVNELLPTTQAGPYSLRLYVDNPTVVLKASQSGTAGEASFRYNWLASCQSTSARLGVEPTAELQVVVLGNPVQDVVDVAITGVQGQPLYLSLTDLQSRLVGQYQTRQAQQTERHQFNVSTQAAGVFLLRVSTNSQTKTVRILKAN